ncbi:MAG TPA: hypothetical protein VJR89_19550 [Polyangiales bacterium]|nr:hypothetical protein [Polyangiales bacterium]
MEHAALDDVSDWTEHGSLLGKQLAYAFSLDVHYRMLAGEAAPARVLLRAIPAHERSTYHVRDDGLTRCAEGLPREVPLARVIRGEDWLELSEQGGSRVYGSLVLSADPPADAPLFIDYRGIASLPRGFAAAAGVPGTAYICTRYRCDLAKYQWLVQQPLFGFGQVFMEQDGAADEPAYRLKFSFDLYFAAPAAIAAG